MAAPWAVTGTVVAANGFEGATSGAITVANSDDNATGTAFAAVQASGASTAIYTTVDALTSACVEFTRSAGFIFVRWDAAQLGTITNDCGGCYVLFETYPSAYTSFLLRLQTDAGLASWRLKVSSAGSIRLTDTLDAAVFSNTANPVVLNQWYRFEWQINHSTNAYVVEWFLVHGLTPEGRNTGTWGAGFGASVQQIQAGALTSPDLILKFQALGISTAKINPMTHTALPPTVSPIASKTATVAGGQTFTVVAVDPEGGTLDYTWRVVSYPGAGSPTLTNGSTATVTVGNLLTDGDVVLGVVVGSNSGAADAAEVFTTLYVSKAPGATVYADEIVNNPGSWSFGGTAANLLDGLTDSGEWIMSPNGPTSATIDIGLPPLPSTDITLDLYVDLVKSDGVTIADPGSTGTLLVRLYDGTTPVSAQQSVSCTPTEVHVTHALSSAENAAYATRTNPILRLTGSASA